MEVARLVASPVVLRLSLTLLHFLWQGLALAALVALGLLALRRARPGARYALLLAALLLMLACPVVTFFALPQPAMASPVPTLAPAASAPIPVSAVRATPPTVNTPSPPAPLAQLRARVAPSLPWLGALWALGVVILSLRLLCGWVGLTSLRRGTRSLEGDWAARLSQLSERLRVHRAVELLESARVLAPMLVGWLRPAILLPAGAVIGLTPDQLEAVIAHELAHLRRHDYLVNLLQSLAETLLFYHPAVWWLSRRIRLERECCCDDLAVAACGDAMVYARALTALGQLSPPQLAPAATGGPLSVRIRRLLSAPAPRPHRPSWLAGAIALAAVGLLIAFLQAPTSAGGEQREAHRLVAQVAAAVEMYRAPNAPASSPAAAAKPLASKLVDIDLRNATVSQCIAALGRASGATIIAEKGLTGTVTVKRRQATIEAVLDAVCRQAGWSWRRHERVGYYYLLAKPATIPDTVKAVEKDPQSYLVVHWHKLSWVSPQYVLYQLGLSDNPGPEGGGRDLPSAGRAARPNLTPTHISEVLAVPEQNALIIRGDPAAVGAFVNFLEDIDKKVQQIIVEAKVFRVNQAALEKYGLQWFSNVMNPALPSESAGSATKTSDLRVGYGKDLATVLDQLLATSQAEVTDAARVVTMNLLPAETGFTSLRVDQQSQWRIDRLVPRINGDATITLYLTLSALAGAGPSDVARPSVNTNLRVRSGEPFAVGGFEGACADSVVVITATIVPER